MPQWKIACQEQLLPGASIEQKWEFAQSAGFDGIELRARDGEAFAARLGVLERAAGRGVVMPSVCLDALPLVGDDLGDGLRQVSSLAALGTRTVVVPLSDLRRVPRQRSSTPDRDTWSDGLRRLAEQAGRDGVSLCLQPVNRYEGRPVNTLDQAAQLCRAAGSPAVRVAAGTFHMNIEEADPAGALLAAGPWLGHVGLADSTGLEPGAGHVDWPALFAALDAAGYEGWTSLACRLSGPAEVVLGAAVGVLRQAGG
ncbi:sugar phosphate isomerase/epimerase [Saccharothrix sp. 6-C]|uniref:Sugar phosphate isomerase/epimerase n=1 Tax=Saccharothrix texasensis TaxID=103734 RepID=A0A3N1H0W3_9PSEU|nr:MULTISPECIES: sugar phosphate isomerase/epimerase family protein [Saccharothrix]QQQ79192.1 sugar phosphate isomerase/epimerase [Saccharothrix sp. 6-C]ROP36016.1 sugar phosphate isomerase/epimerase [Saccharothrix texasensis]